jgi:hypothetical protein
MRMEVWRQRGTMKRKRVDLAGSSQDQRPISKKKKELADA